MVVAFATAPLWKTKEINEAGKLRKASGLQEPLGSQRAGCHTGEDVTYDKMVKTKLTATKPPALERDFLAGLTDSFLVPKRALPLDPAAQT